ncbi:MAG: amino acid permease, partial [Clostridia bacterium]|nr:amino acid permease [Clostridia bacterium]
PWTPLLSLVFSLYLMLNLPALTWVRFAVWLVVGLIIYLAYGHRASRLAEQRAGRVPAFLPGPAAKPWPGDREARRSEVREEGKGD